MKSGSSSSRETVSGGIASSPGINRSWEMSRSGSYIGCGNSGAAMIGSIGSSSGGCQASSSVTCTIDAVRAGTVNSGFRPTSREALSPPRSAGSASGSSNCVGLSAWASLVAAVRNPAASGESLPAGTPVGAGESGKWKPGWGRRLGHGAGIVHRREREATGRGRAPPREQPRNQSNDKEKHTRHQSHDSCQHDQHHRDHSQCDGKRREPSP